jgi:ferredoxin-NADP reductase
MIRQEVPDFMERTFYLSGPHAMVVSAEEVLQHLSIPQKQIKKDFFPGLA